MGENRTQPQVRVVPASKVSLNNRAQLKFRESIRVAAYCRVSTENEDQETSYEGQKAYYSAYIQGRPGWEFAGIYADKGISGTSTAHRDEFNRMIEDARAGRIDYILTKSISRFARNTIITLEYARELKALDPPVGIFFEKENIDSLDATSEFVFTIMSAIAQDESRSVSENIKWSVRKGFEAGIPKINFNNFLGYDKGEHGEFVINEEQAKMVRFIYSRYLETGNASQVAREMNEKGWKTVRGNRWTGCGLIALMKNEKYAGDLKMQKYVTDDFLTHKSVVNNGQAPSYFVADHHEPIVDRVTWSKAQAMLEGRTDRVSKNRREKAHVFKNVFSILTCGCEREDGRKCGAGFRRIPYTTDVPGYKDERSMKATGEEEEGWTERYSRSYGVWKCRGSEDEDRPPCTQRILNEVAMKQSFMEMIYAVKRDRDRYGEDCRIIRMFREVYDRAVEDMERGSADYQHAGRLREQLDSLDKKIAEMETRQIEAKVSEDNRRLRGEMDTGIGSESSIYSGLLADMRRRKDELEEKLRDIEERCGGLDEMKRSFEFFLQCLDNLPDVNSAGMPVVVNGLDTDGSIFRSAEGDIKHRKLGTYRRGRISITPEMIEAAPDFLEFDEGLFCAVVESAVACGDAIRYGTKFGVELECTGNTRVVGSFLGYKRSLADGTVEFLDQPYKVLGERPKYTRMDPDGKVWKEKDLEERRRKQDAADTQE